MCLTASLPASSGLDRSSALSETSSLQDSFVLLDLDFQNAVFHRFRSACGAIPLFWLYMPAMGTQTDS